MTAFCCCYFGCSFFFQHVSANSIHFLWNMLNSAGQALLILSPRSIGHLVVLLLHTGAASLPSFNTCSPKWALLEDLFPALHFRAPSSPAGLWLCCSWSLVSNLAPIGLGFRVFGTWFSRISSPPIQNRFGYHSSRTSSLLHLETSLYSKMLLNPYQIHNQLWWLDFFSSFLYLYGWTGLW